MHLLRRVERHIRATDIKPTRLGREAVRDPRFVFDLRMGREPRPATESRVHAWLDAREAEGAAR